MIWHNTWPWLCFLSLVAIIIFEALYFPIILGH